MKNVCEIFFYIYFALGAPYEFALTNKIIKT